MYVYDQQEYVELGSSSGSNQPLINRTNSKPNLTLSTMTSSDLSDPPLEPAPNLALPATSFNPSLVETPQSHRPTTVYILHLHNLHLEKSVYIIISIYFFVAL